MKRIRTLLLGTAMAIPAAGHAQEMTTINLIQPIPLTTLVYAQIAAETLGFFEEEGIEVNLLPSDTSIPYVAFLQNGQADIAMLDPSETFAAVNAGAGIKTIFEVTQRAPEGIAVAADSEVQSMQDLVGTTVGLVTDRDRGFLAQALLAVGLSIDDVDTVVVGDAGPTLAAALQGQTVSAVSGAALDWGAIEASGIEIRLITPPEAVETPANSFAINAERLDELRPVLEGFLRAWAKGAYVGEVDVDILAEIGRQAVPEEWEDEEFGRSFVQIGLDLGLPLTEQYGDLRDDIWQEIQPRMMAVGDLEQLVPLESFLDDSLIDAANDWSREEVEAQIRAWGAENM